MTKELEVLQQNSIMVLMLMTLCAVKPRLSNVTSSVVINPLPLPGPPMSGVVVEKANVKSAAEAGAAKTPAETAAVSSLCV